MNSSVAGVMAAVVAGLLVVAFALYGISVWAEEHWEGWKQDWNRRRDEAAERRSERKRRQEAERREHEAEEAEQERQREAEEANQKHQRETEEAKLKAEEAQEQRQRQEAEKERQRREAELRAAQHKAIDEWQRRDVGTSTGLYVFSGLSALAGAILIVIAVTNVLQETSPESAAIRQVTWTMHGMTGLILIALSGVLYGLGKLINRS